MTTAISDDVTTTSSERTDATTTTAISDDVTTTSGKLKRTDATMTIERSDGATTTSADLPGGADATTITIEENDGSRRAGEKDAGLRRLSTTGGATLTDNTQRHRAGNKFSGASK